MKSHLAHGLLSSLVENSKIIYIQRDKKLTGSVSNLLILKPKSVQSLRFKFAVSFIWDLQSFLNERRSKFEKIKNSAPVIFTM